MTGVPFKGDIWTQTYPEGDGVNTREKQLSAGQGKGLRRDLAWPAHLDLGLQPCCPTASLGALFCPPCARRRCGAAGCGVLGRVPQAEPGA